MRPGCVRQTSFVELAATRVPAVHIRRRRFLSLPNHATCSWGHRKPMAGRAGCERLRATRKVPVAIPTSRKNSWTGPAIPHKDRVQGRPLGSIGRDNGDRPGALPESHSGCCEGRKGQGRFRSAVPASAADRRYRSLARGCQTHRQRTDPRHSAVTKPSKLRAAVVRGENRIARQHPVNLPRSGTPSNSKPDRPYLSVGGLKLRATCQSDSRAWLPPMWALQRLY